MRVCICNQILGTRFHLIHDFEAETFEWSSKIPDNCWVIGDSSSFLDLEDLALGIGTKLQILPHKKYVRQFQDILGDDIESWSRRIAWQQVLPSNDFKRFATEILQNTQEILKSPYAISYGEVLKNARQALLGLSRAKVAPMRWRLCRGLAQGGQLEAVDSFRPDSEGFAPTVVYGRSETTGRMVIRRGPRILHLKKNYRKVITSRWKGGRVVQFDYVSMEPRILMDLVGKNPTDDVYEFTSKVVLDGKVDRDQSKVIVMGVLYGIGTTKLQSILGTNVNASRVMDEVRSNFGVKILENRLKREFKEKGFITNHYGRVLKPQRKDGSGLVSWHVQSTGADLALQGFGQLMGVIENEGVQVKPLFFIHDALLLDVHPSVTDYDLVKLAAVASKPPGFEHTFPLKVTHVDS